jgi:hypothetical protein
MYTLLASKGASLSQKNNHNQDEKKFYQYEVSQRLKHVQHMRNTNEQGDGISMEALLPPSIPTSYHGTQYFSSLHLVMELI